MAKRNKKNNPLSVAFVALGCAKNLVDSESMIAAVGQGGFVLSSDVNNADIVIINTCGFIKPAKDEAIDEISKAVNAKKTGSVKKVIIAGCLAQRMGVKLLEEIPGIDAIAGLGARDDIVKIIKQTLNQKADKTENVFIPQDNSFLSDDTDRLLLTYPGSAYLRISQGCSRKCAFCTIPAIRGPFRSKSQAQIIKEAKQLAQNDVSELNLIAQDTSNYGRDQNRKNALVNLLTELQKIDPLKWIRLMYLYPTGISDELIETIAGAEKIVNYIDMPIQHISNSVLKRMSRPDTKEQTTALVEKLRTHIPDVVLRTTIIVGYPGETEADFAELCDFVKWAKFDALGCFPYFAEEDTPAAMLDGQLPDEIKNQRAEQLMLIQQQIAFDNAKKRIGNELDCIVEDVDPQNNAIGRYFGQAPQVDSICHITDCTAAPGQMIKVKVTDTENYDLITKQISG